MAKIFSLLTVTHAQDREPQTVNIVTIEQAVSATLQTNPDLRSFGKNIDIAEQNIDLARSNYRPNVNVTGDLSYSRSDQSVIPGQDTNFVTKSAALNVQQPLYRGGQTIAEVREQAKLKEVTESEFETLSQNMILDVVETYMAAYRALQATRVNEDNAVLLEEESKATQARFEAGELTRTDTSQARARLAEAQAFVTQSRAVYETTIARLTELTGLGDIQELRYPQTDEDILPRTLDEALKVGLMHNPQIQTAEQQILAQTYNIEQQEGAFLPQLSAAAVAGYEDNPSGFGQSSSRQTATVGLNATIPIYQSGVLRNRVQQAKILKDQARDELQSAKRAVTNNIISAWENYKTFSSEIAARESQLEASRIAFEGVRLEEELGARSVLDVLDVNQDVLEAELALIDAKRDKVNAYYRLLGAIGLLKESIWDNS